MTGRPTPHQSGHLQESSFPLWRTWACHAKALPHRLLLQARGETQKEAEELKKANILSFFFKYSKSEQCGEDTDLDLWKQRLWQ